MKIKIYALALCLSFLSAGSVFAQTINGTATLKIVPTGSTTAQFCDHLVADTAKIQLSLNGLSGSVQLPEENISIQGKFLDQVAEYEKAQKHLAKLPKHRRAPAAGTTLQSPEPLLILSKQLGRSTRRKNMELLSFSINKTDGTSVSLIYSKLQGKKNVCYRIFNGKLVR